MSGDNSHAPEAGYDEAVAAATPRLLRRVREAGHDRTPEEVMSAATGDVVDPDATFDEELVTCSLDEILLALVTLRTEGTHGTGLIDDIDGLFGVEPSPGTVYPRLHDLDAEGPLARHDLVRTKQYVVDDDSAARERLESAMHQHLAVGLFLAAALDTV